MISTDNQHKTVFVDWFLQSVAGLCFILMISLLLYLITDCEAQAMAFSPMVYPECQDRSLNELIDHLPDWGWRAVEIIGHGERSLTDLNESTDGDCGNVGVFHLQPPDGLNLNRTAVTECPASDQEWVWWTLSLLYSEYSAELQADAWLDIVGPTVMIAIENDATTEEAAGIAAMCNSGPAHVRRWAAERETWELTVLIDAYLDHRDTSHRRRRVARIIGAL